MRAIQVRRTGGPAVLELCERPNWTDRSRSARVRVIAAGVNYIDVYERTGMYPRAPPYLAGGEGVGIVTEVAANTFEVTVGDRVAWQGVPGSYAEELAAPIGQLLSVPTAINDHVAAALPLQGLTAHYLATESYSTGPGDTVVVHAGAGGVGLLLTQIAKLRGARVITTVSNPEKARLSRRAGADAAVPYRELRAEVDKTTGGRGVQAVSDSVGGDTFNMSLGARATPRDPRAVRSIQRTAGAVRARPSTPRRIAHDHEAHPARLRCYTRRTHAPSSRALQLGGRWTSQGPRVRHLPTRERQ